jgi:DNA-binding NtrC family response regulator
MKPKILLIDDEKDITEALPRFLTDYEVVTAADGASGLAAAASARPELVLLDVHLPDMSGLEVLEDLLSMDFKPLVIMLTGDEAVETAAKAIAGGAFAYITKPFEGPQVVEQVRKAFTYLKRKRRP